MFSRTPLFLCFGILILLQGWNDVTGTNVLLAHRHSHSHITNNSHFTVLALAHSMLTCTLKPHRSHIDQNSTRTLQCWKNRTTRTFRCCEIKTTRTLTKLALTHSGVVQTGPLAHWPVTKLTLAHQTSTCTLWPDHSHIDQTSTRTFRCCANRTTRTLTKLALAHSGVVKASPLAHWSN